MQKPPCSTSQRVHISNIAALLLLATSSSHGELTNRWSFNTAVGNALAGTTIADRVGTANAAVVGGGAGFDGSALVLPGSTTGNESPANISAYVDLPNGLISSKTHLSVEVWA